MLVENLITSSDADNWQAIIFSFDPKINESLHDRGEFDVFHYFLSFSSYSDLELIFQHLIN